MKVIRWNGQPISAPGIYSGVPIDTYHTQLTVTPSISNSGLKTIFTASAAHYYDKSYLNPDNWETVDGVLTFKEQPAGEPLIFGRGSHHLILGEADFRKHFAIQPAEYPDPKTGDAKPWNNNAAYCRKWHAEAKRERLTVLTQNQVEAIRGMAAGLAAHPMVRSGILIGLIEHSIVWQDRETGVWLKVRPDAIPTDDADFVDLKSQADVTDDGIEKAIGTYGYNMQGALVRMASREVLGREMNSFSLIFSEKARPHVARVKTLKPADLDLGERQVRVALRMFAQCLETGTWPGPGGEQTDAEYVELRTYDRNRIEYRLALLEQGLAA